MSHATGPESSAWRNQRNFDARQRACTVRDESLDEPESPQRLLLGTLEQLLRLKKEQQEKAAGIAKG